MSDTASCAARSVIPRDTWATSWIRVDETSASHGGFTFSEAMFYSPFATVPTGGPLDV